MLKLIVSCLLLVACLQTYGLEWSEKEIQKIQSFSFRLLGSPIDHSNQYLNNQNAISLGKRLFNDKRLSSNSDVSCSSCHIESLAFTDNKKVAIGLREGFRNTPTLLDASHHHWFFADGAKDSLWSQALSSIENPAEQNFTRVELLRLLSQDEGYRILYEQIFPDALPQNNQLQTYPLMAGPNAELKLLIAWKKLTKAQKIAANTSFVNSGKAIAAYVSTLKSKMSRFDQFIDEIKDKSASTKLSESEQRGLKVFINEASGCANCHSGPLFSNKTFHNIATGILGKDNGRSEVIDSVIRDEFNCLSQYSDARPDQCVELKYVNRNRHQLSGSYKTPTLRNLSKTAPYMHDGRFDNLNDVIKHYRIIGKSGLKTDLNALHIKDNEVQDLANFLSTL